MHVFSALPGKRSQKVVLFTLIALVTLTSALFLFNSILGQSLFRSIISSHGTVKAIGVAVYWDNNCSVPVFSIDWGLVEPGSASNVTFCIKNEGNYALTLFIGAENWNPENAADYLSLISDYDGQIINPGEAVQVTLSLLASSDTKDLTNFSFDVIIDGNA